MANPFTDALISAGGAYQGPREPVFTTDSAMDVLLDVIEGYIAPADDVVWHYTTAVGLEGILSSGCIRATDIRFLNDTTELTYGRRLCCEELRSSGPNEAFQRFFSETATGLESVPIAGHYAASFCADGDLITQWSGYGAAGAGYAIGFDRHALAVSGPAALTRVEYQEDHQRTRVRHFLFEAERALQRSIAAQGSKATVDLLRAGGTAVAAALTLFSIGFKDPMFAHEREYRLVEYINVDEKADLARVHFRDAQGVLVPYIDVDLTSSGSLPVVAVMCGPTLNHRASMESVALLLQRLGLTAEVRKSRAPLHKY